MKCYTATTTSCTPGIAVAKMQINLPTGKITIPCVHLGGDGRDAAKMAVGLLPAAQADFEAGKPVTIYHAVLGKSKNGKDKLIQTASTPSGDHALVAFRVSFGYRGGCDLTGDRVDRSDKAAGFRSWPGNDLMSGYISGSGAGALGQCYQPLTIMPPDRVFRVAMSGRNIDPARYGIFQNDEVLYLTWEEFKKSH